MIKIPKLKNKNATAFVRRFIYKVSGHLWGC